MDGNGRGHTLEANKKFLNHSQSRSTSSSSSFLISGSLIASAAAAKCSCRIKSTVILNSGSALSAKAAKPSNDDDRGDEILRSLEGGVGGECERPNMLVPFPFAGVTVPVPGKATLGRFGRTSEQARRSRFVVPSAFVDPDRAEQTMATLFPSM